MQSPLTFEFNNSHSPYNPIAQMFLTSPMEGMNQLPAPASGTDSLNGPTGDEENSDRKGAERKVAIANGYGMFTPGRSCENKWRSST